MQGGPHRDDLPGWHFRRAGPTQTNGTYSVTVGAEPPGGTYTASVPKITMKNKKTGKKKKCLAATSNPVVLP